MEKKIEELNGFKDLRIVDNFYQTSSFFPMPTTEIGTLSESGLTNLGSYSLCFPYYIAGKDYYAMILCCRNSSNTAKNILRTGKCTINFITDKRKYFKEAVRLGYPGETTEEKMKDCIFNLVDGKRARENPNEQYPKIIQEAFQVFECTWVSELDNASNDKVMDEYNAPFHDFNGITSKYGAHFILKIDNILIKPKQKMIESDYFEWYFLTSEWRAKTSDSFSFNILAFYHKHNLMLLLKYTFLL